MSNTLRNEIQALASSFGDSIFDLFAKHLTEMLTVKERIYIEPFTATTPIAGKRAASTKRSKPAAKPAAKAKRIVTCKEPGCRRPSSGPRYGFRCVAHRDAWAAARAKAKAPTRPKAQAKRKAKAKPANNGTAQAASPAG